MKRYFCSVQRDGKYLSEYFDGEGFSQDAAMCASIRMWDPFQHLRVDE